MKDLTYSIEERFLSEYAFKSKNTFGRQKEEEPCPMRTDFQRDRDRIIHSKAFRRLKNKTQVFIYPGSDHIRTRLTHTLSVAQIARSIARALSLNEDLTEAIALGHDLGHTPFGHAGERSLDKLADGFSHNKQSLRVVDILENDGEGLNLTYEVRDGILNHRKNDFPETLEGQAVSLADRIAYLNDDFDDAVRAGVLLEDHSYLGFFEILGNTHRERINNMIMSIYKESLATNCVKMEQEFEFATDEFRTFMFKNVYLNDYAKEEEEKVFRMIESLFGYYYDNAGRLPEFYSALLTEYSTSEVICDYISSMSDAYAINLFEEIFMPKIKNFRN